MLTAQITLDAALRDIDSEKERYRFQAAANLAPALLEQLGKPGPRWRATTEHARGPAVREALLGVLHEDEPAPLRGTAAVGLGTLGEPAVLDATEAWLESTDDDEASAYLRESALLASTYLGRAALEAGAALEAHEVIQRVRDRVERALRAEAAELRFQAATALVELGDAEAEPVLVDALRRETHPDVRQGLVDALAYLDPPGDAACEVLEALVAGPDGHESIGFDAAVTLAAARRPSARPRLLQSLAVRHQRDRALEALAALGGGTPAEVEPVHRLARQVWLPAITRVRAAYALARMVPPGSGDNPGLTMLRRLRWHPRPAVREAVRDAFANLETLGPPPSADG
ncbi:MAG: HEAT repeat domain-containing protein [Myxococcales bacterium]|nr:HEAT repeat domain-containing protein [Myxococcales bacterium]